MKENDNIINFTDRKIVSTLEKIDETKQLQDMEHLEGEDLKEAILRSIDDGDINLLSISQCIMNLAGALDKLEHNFATLSMYVILKLKEKDLAEEGN